MRWRLPLCLSRWQPELTRAPKSGPCLRRGRILRARRRPCQVSRRAVLRRVRRRPAHRRRVRLRPAHRASREILIAEAEAAIQIAAAATTQTVAVAEMIQAEAAAGMILIGAIGTPDRVDVAILIVDQPIPQVAARVAATAMAAAIGATERQLIPARSIPREPPIQTGAGIGILIAAEIVAGIKTAIATKTRTRIEIGARIETKTAIRIGIATKTVTEAKIETATGIAIVTRAVTVAKTGIEIKTVIEIATNMADEGTTVIAIPTIRTTSIRPSTMSGTMIGTFTARAPISAAIRMACSLALMTPAAARVTIRSARTSLRAHRVDTTQPTGSAPFISKRIATASWLVTTRAIGTGRGISPGASLPDIRRRELPTFWKAAV